MEQLRDMRLEMSLMLPAAILFQAGRDRQEGGSPSLKVERKRQILKLMPVGVWGAEMLLEGLPKVLRVPDRSDCLELTLDRLGGFDDLALSALIVVLRNYSARFKTISLAGLPLWASARICQTGAENLLGNGWSMEHQPDITRFHFFN